MRGKAIAAYQSFVFDAEMGIEEDAEEILPYIEIAIFESTQLLMDQMLWQDVYNNAELYKRLFPGGRYAPQLSAWKLIAETNGAEKESEIE